jgi:hypothetical protein
MSFGLPATVDKRPSGFRLLLHSRPRRLLFASLEARETPCYLVTMTACTSPYGIPLLISRFERALVPCSTAKSRPVRFRSLAIRLQ